MRGNAQIILKASDHQIIFCFSEGVLWQDSQGYLRGRADSSLREVRQDLGSSSDDGSNDWTEQVSDTDPKLLVHFNIFLQGLRIHHLHNTRRGAGGCETGNPGSTPLTNHQRIVSKMLVIFS